jgi:hypothetical protein
LLIPGIAHRGQWTWDSEVAMTDPSGLQGDKIQGLIARAKGIILTPQAEWQVIEGEPATLQSLYTGYIMILAAIRPVAEFVHNVAFGRSYLIATYRPPFFTALVQAVVGYALALAGAYVVALIVDALAPTFSGQKSQTQALKLVAYSMTAAWLAGIFDIVPGLGVLSILGLYSAYLFYVGLPVMMKSPPDKSLAYTAVVIVATIVVMAVIVAVSAPTIGSGVLGSVSEEQYAADGTVTLPGGTEVNLSKLQQAANTVANSAARAQSGSNPAGIATDTLKKFLPDSLGGLTRQEYSGAGGQLAGLGASAVEGKYGTGDKRVTLDVTDMGEMGALASLGSVLGVNGDKETPTSYTKVREVDGRTLIEDYDRDTHHGSYSVIAGSRFLVKAEGYGVSMDELKAAVGEVDLKALEALAK